MKRAVRYCCFDSRVADLGRLVKAFVKSRELVGTADGFLNSYAFAGWCSLFNFWKF